MSDFNEFAILCRVALILALGGWVEHPLHYSLQQGWPTQMILRATLEMHHNSAGRI